DLLPLAHHTQVTVVQAQHLGRKPVLLAGGQFLDVHLDGTFAGDNGNVGIRVGHLHTHGVGQAHAHGAQATGIHPAARVVEAVVLGCPHLVLADVGRNERLTAGDFPELFNDELRLDERGGVFVGQALLAAPGVDLLPPVGQRCFIGGRFGRRLLVHGVQFLEHVFHVADDGNIDAHTLGNGGGINVDVDDFAGVLGKMLGVADNSVVEARTDGDEDVAVLHGHVGLVGAVHAGHTHELVVGSREGA